MSNSDTNVAVINGCEILDIDSGWKKGVMMHILDATGLPKCVMRDGHVTRHAACRIILVQTDVEPDDSCVLDTH